MFSLLVAVTVFENFETFDTAVDVFNFYSVSGKTAVKRFLLRSELAAFGFFERRYAECVKVAYPLKTFVPHKQNIVKYMYPALFVHLEIVYRTFCLAHTYNLSTLTVYYQQILYCVTFLLA